jgi:hypothetical protein
MTMMDGNYRKEDLVFTGGDGDGNYLDEPGWFVAKLVSITSRDRDGNRLANSNGKIYSRFRFQVIGGICDGKTITDNFYSGAAFRVERLCAAAGVPCSRDENRVIQFDELSVMERPFVMSVTFQQGSDRLQVKSPVEKVPEFITIDQGRDMHEKGIIEIVNIEVLAPADENDPDRF